jgi:hypothetical protein
MKVFKNFITLIFIFACTILQNSSLNAVCEAVETFERTLSSIGTLTTNTPAIDDLFSSGASGREIFASMGAAVRDDMDGGFSPKIEETLRFLSQEEEMLADIERDRVYSILTLWHRFCHRAGVDHIETCNCDTHNTHVRQCFDCLIAHLKAFFVERYMMGILSAHESQIKREILSRSEASVDDLKAFIRTQYQGQDPLDVLLLQTLRRIQTENPGTITEEELTGVEIGDEGIIPVLNQKFDQLAGAFIRVVPRRSDASSHRRERRHHDGPVIEEPDPDDDADDGDEHGGQGSGLSMGPDDLSALIDARLEAFERAIQENNRLLLQEFTRITEELLREIKVQNTRQSAALNKILSVLSTIPSAGKRFIIFALKATGIRTALTTLLRLGGIPTKERLLVQVIHNIAYVCPTLIPVDNRAEFLADLIGYIGLIYPYLPI